MNPKQASRFHGLELADPVPRESGTVDVLLGGRYYFSLMQGSVVQPDVPETGPFAIETMFGWVLAGPCPKNELSRSNLLTSNCLLVSITDNTMKSDLDHWQLLDRKLERFWTQESVGLIDKEQVYTSDDIDALRQYNSSVEFDGVKYCVSLPFKPGFVNLQHNYPEAFSRLMSTEKVLRKDPIKLLEYDEAIMDYETNGFSRKLRSDEFETIRQLSHYFVPHHPVFRESSSSTKLRIVFDASSKDGSELSLTIAY